MALYRQCEDYGAPGCLGVAEGQARFCEPCKERRRAESKRKSAAKAKRWEQFREELPEWRALADVTEDALERTHRPIGQGFEIRAELLHASALERYDPLSWIEPVSLLTVAPDLVRRKDPYPPVFFTSLVDACHAITEDEAERIAKAAKRNGTDPTPDAFTETPGVGFPPPWAQLLGFWLRTLRESAWPYVRETEITDGVDRLDPAWVVAFFHVIQGWTYLDPQTRGRPYYCPDCRQNRHHRRCKPKPFRDKTKVSTPPYVTPGMLHAYKPEDAVRKLWNAIQKDARAMNLKWAMDHVEDGDSRNQGKTAGTVNPSRTDNLHEELENRSGPPLDELDERGGPRKPRPSDEEPEDEEDGEAKAGEMLGDEHPDDRPTPTPEGWNALDEAETELDPEGPDGPKKKRKPKKVRDALGNVLIEAPCSPWRSREEAEANPWTWPTPTWDEAENEKRKDKWCKFLNEQAARREFSNRFAVGPRRRPLRDELRTHADPVADDVIRRAPDHRDGAWLAAEDNPQLCLACARPAPDDESTPKGRRAARLHDLGVDNGTCRCPKPLPPGRPIELATGNADKLDALLSAGPAETDPPRRVQAGRWPWGAILDDAEGLWGPAGVEVDVMSARVLYGHTAVITAPKVKAKGRDGIFAVLPGRMVLDGPPLRERWPECTRCALEELAARYGGRVIAPLVYRVGVEELVKELEAVLGQVVPPRREPGAERGHRMTCPRRPRDGHPLPGKYPHRARSALSELVNA